ncbi:MAG TPA: S8 family peptidase [Permianibacter sp.]|nr:S8 family peptidase [Permianibacter sp.]
MSYAVRRNKLRLVAAMVTLACAGVAAAQTPNDRFRLRDAEPEFDRAELLAARAAARAQKTGLTDRLIIKYKDGSQSTGKTGLVTVSALDRASAKAGERLQLVRKNAFGAQVMKLDRKLTEREVSAIAARIAEDADVEYAEPDRIMKPFLTPTDSQYSSQWHYYESTGGLRAPAAWDITNGAGVVVAVLDTGYRPHADLAANLLPGYDMISDTAVGNDGNGRDSDAQDPGDWIAANECGGTHAAQDSSWHGTHVAGTIAAVTNNGNGVAGVAYGAKVVPVRVLGKCGGYTSDIADGIIWASGGTVSGVPANANPAKVINMSLGGSGACDTTTQNAINGARSRGTVIVVAAGNDNANANNFNPGNCAGVVNVAATNRSGGRAYYSNYGTSVDVAAPGGAQSSANDANGVLSTWNSGTSSPGSDAYVFMQGTSMAAPHVAGVAALIKAVKPAATPDEIETILKTTARAFPATCSNCGTGIVDANAAVLNAQGGGGGGGGGTMVLSNGVPVTGLSAATNASVTYTMTVPAGATNLTFSSSGGTGDADMYVKFGSAPTTSSYDCRPYKSGNAESCSFATPTAGTWYVTLRAYSAFSGVSLTGSYSTGSGGGGGGTLIEVESNNSTGTAQTVSTSGTTVNGTIGSTSDTDYYKVTLPAGATLTSTLTPNSTSDYDLIVYNASGTEIGRSEKGAGQVDAVAVTNTGSTASVRYIRVVYYSGGTGSTSGKYTLKATW